MQKWIATVFFLAFYSIGFSQTNADYIRCGQQSLSDIIHSQNPKLDSILRENEFEIQRWISSNKKNATIQSVITIPVVFHVLYNTTEQNLPDEQLVNQLDVMNRDFRRQNPDSVLTPTRFKPISADTEIEFCLAQQTPDGQPTNGIIRKDVNQSNIGSTKNYYQPNLGGTQIWDPRYYLNVWICEINDTLLGFTYLPGEAQPNFDGVVLNYKVCGDGLPTKPPYNKGRTLVHEVGHWLGLQHPWGPKEGCNYDDAISDTPLQEKPNSGCPNQPVISCNNGPNGDMYMNYMDYTYDNCQTAFTYGQRDRMQGTLNTTRKLLLNSNGCSLPDTTAPFVEFVEVLSNPITTLLTLRFNLSSTQNAEILIYDITGKLIYVENKTVEIERIYIDFSVFQAGSYIVKALTSTVQSTFKIVKIE